MLVRLETPSDYAAIRDINIAAFLHHPFSHQTEHLIIEELRAAGALSVSLVAETEVTEFVNSSSKRDHPAFMAGM